MAHPHALAIALLSIGLAPAGAQPQIPKSAPSVDCRAMAAQSQGRMSQAQCEQQFGGFAAMIDAMNQPGGERPGDAAMTCDQIATELKVTAIGGVSRENANEGVVAAKDLDARMKKIQAEAAAASAAQTAINASAAAAGTVAGNAASGAAMASQMAMQETFNAKARAELDPAIARVQSANAASMVDVTRMVQANPRVGRLIQLAGAKNCQMP